MAVERARRIKSTSTSTSSSVWTEYDLISKKEVDEEVEVDEDLCLSREPARPRMIYEELTLIVVILLFLFL